MGSPVIARGFNPWFGEIRGRFSSADFLNRFVTCRLLNDRAKQKWPACVGDPPRSLNAPFAIRSADLQHLMLVGVLLHHPHLAGCLVVLASECEPPDNVPPFTGDAPHLEAERERRHRLPAEVFL